MGVSYSYLNILSKASLRTEKLLVRFLKIISQPLALTSPGLLSWRGAVSDGSELRLDVHVVVLDVPGGQSW